MRVLLAVVLMMLLHASVLAEAPAVTEAAARPTVLPRTTLSPGLTNSRLQCFVEIGQGVIISYRPLSVAPIKRRSESSILIVCDNANTSQTDGQEMSLVCSGCKVDIGNAIATSPKATVDTDNNRLTLTGTEDSPVILTIGKGDKARTVSAKDLAISIND
jgi:hypothetical protein